MCGLPQAAIVSARWSSAKRKRMLGRGAASGSAAGAAEAAPVSTETARSQQRVERLISDALRARGTQEGLPMITRAQDRLKLPPRERGHANTTHRFTARQTSPPFLIGVERSPRTPPNSVSAAARRPLRAPPYLGRPFPPAPTVGIILGSGRRGVPCASSDTPRSM